MSILEEQKAYYRARAPEYDEWFFRCGRYDRGPEHRAEWAAEIAQVEAAVLPLVTGKEVVELACGTGLWTAKIARVAKRVMAVDASPEAIAIGQTRLQRCDNVKFKHADIFVWRPKKQFDVVFFSFWMSHVPERRFKQFWETVCDSLREDGNAVFVDSLLEQTSTARNHLPVDRSGVVRRKLNDGREFRIIKIFHHPPDLERRLEQLGWNGWVNSTPKFFLFGQASRRRGA